MDPEQKNLSLEQVLGILRRRTPWILLCFVLVAGAAYGFSKQQTKKYTATASLVFNNNQLAQQAAGLPAVASESQQAQQNTNLKLVQLGDLAAKTATILGQGLTENEVSGDVSVSAETESNVVNVSATATTPTLAADIANAYTRQFVAEQERDRRGYYVSAVKQVNKQLAALSAKERAGAAGLALEQRAQSLGTLAELHNGTVQVAQAANVPTSPSSPKVARNTVLGGVLGLLLGLGLAALLERFDRRIREPKDLEAIYRLPLLGVVPASAALSRSGRRKGKAQGALPHSEAEAFRLIRAHLRYFNVDRELRTLLVTSAAPGDGKTTVAHHLASAAASMGSRVLLLEADLRKPTLAEELDVQSQPGMSDVLIGAVSLSEATQIVDLEPSSVAGSRGRMLDVVVAGAVAPPNPGELIESRAMEALLERAKSTYDLVVIDTPPLAAVSDAFALLRKVDGVIIVGRVGRNRRDVAERLHETLAGAGAPLLGVVANGLKVRRLGSYGNTYEYGYAEAERPPTPAYDEAERLPAAGASANGASANGASANGASADRTSADATYADETAADETLDDETLDDETLDDETAADTTSADATYAHASYAHASYADRASADTTSADATSADATSAHAAPRLARWRRLGRRKRRVSGAPLTPAKASETRTSADATSADRTSADATYADAAYAYATYADAAYAYAAPADATSGDRVPPPEEPAPAQPVPRMPPTYGEAVDFFGDLGDLPVDGLE